jgi:hypothetical protein
MPEGEASPILYFGTGKSQALGGLATVERLKSRIARARRIFIGFSVRGGFVFFRCRRTVLFLNVPEGLKDIEDT